MGSTGEPDRKRQLSSSFVPGAAVVAPAKRPALPPCSDDKKLDFAVLKYRNQKLLEQLEVHKFEYRALESKFDDLKQRQKLVRDLEITSVCKSRSQNSACSTGHSNLSTDGACISQDKDFLSRLVETGATENSGCHLENHVQSSTADVLQNVLLSSNDSWHANKKFFLALFSALPENECSRQLRITANELSLDLNDAVQALGDLHLKRRQLTENYHNQTYSNLEDQRYSNAESKAEQKHLKEELTSTVAELEEMNYKLAILKAQRDTTNGTPILFPTLGNKSTPGRPADNVRDKQKELQDLEASRKEFTDLVSKRLAEVKRLHEVRIEILNKLATFQNTLTDFKSISSSKACQVLNDQLQKSQAELDHSQTLLEKLQVDKDKLIWQEREINVKVDLAEIPHRVSVHCESSIADLEQNLRKVADEKNMLVLKLEESSRELGVMITI